MVHFHSKRPELILQEICSAFIIFNFTKAAAWEVDTTWGSSKYKRRVNFSDAVYLCCILCGAGFLTCCLPWNENSCSADQTAVSRILSLPKTAFPPCMYPLDNLPLSLLLFGFSG